jgi:transcriptional regulator with XRE-family HTH domain
MADAAADAPWLRHLRAEVRARLEARHATQASLADHLGISAKHLNQILGGHVNGSPALLARIAEAVGVQIAIVVTGREPVPLAEDKRPWKSGYRGRRAKPAAAEGSS